MKVYIAGKLGTERERKFLERISKLCSDLGIKTYLPHRDGGLCKGMKDVKKIFKKDIIMGMANCNLIIAVLEGLHVGSGTAWELGYGYAKGIKLIGIKKDEDPKKALDYLSPILIGSMKIVKTEYQLKKEIKNLMKKN